MDLDPALRGPRATSYWVEMLDRSGAPIGNLDGTTDPATGARRPGLIDGSLSYNVDSEIMGGGSLTIAAPAGIDWHTVRFRPWVLVNDRRWPLGVYVPASPEHAYTATGKTATVSILDLTSIPASTRLTATWSTAAGTDPVAAVADRLAVLFGAPATVLTPTTKRTASAMTWPAGTTWLSVFNDLLTSVGYNRLWCDNLGQYRSEPWVDPATVEPEIIFAEGSDAIHAPEFTTTQDVAGVPNRMICTTAGDDTTPGMVAVATNTDPASPYSYQRRGRWVDAYRDGVEAADLATLNAYARKELTLNTSPPWYVTVSHYVIPLRARNVVRFASADVDRVAWVNEWGITLRTGSLMTGKWLGVTA